MKNFRSILLLFLAAAIIPAGCNNSAGPDSDQARLEQIPGCKSGQLAKGGLANDSCFTYQFAGTLDVYFCASANCCPDSDRFLFKHQIRSDAIFVTISDTAAHLCRCNCTYLLHAEFHDLPGDRYVFVCMRDDYSSVALLYSAIVQRQ